MPSAYLSPTEQVLPPSGELGSWFFFAQQASGDQDKQLTNVLERIHEILNDMLEIQGGTQLLPSEIDSLSYSTPSAIKKLEDLKDDWDGRGSLPMPDLLIAYATFLWREIKSKFADYPEPVLNPGPNGLVVFAWHDTASHKILKIGLYCEGEIIACDWYLDLHGNISSGELEHFSTPELLAKVGTYFNDRAS